MYKKENGWISIASMALLLFITALVSGIALIVTQTIFILEKIKMITG